MLINDVLYSADYSQFAPIGENCHQFFEESDGFPMVKLLPRTYDSFRKVKIRKRNQAGAFDEAFNGAFVNEMHQLRERALFANGGSQWGNNASLEPFYVFPIDGYDFIYSKDIKDSSINYSSSFIEIFNQLGESSGEEVFAELLKFNYTATNLSEGLSAGSEIIIYGIPYYYAVRESTINDYENLLTIF